MLYKDFYETELNEIQFADTYPKAFMEFYKKWKKFKSNSKLFVRFDNGSTSDVLAKSPSNDPSHSDMIGVYAYPIKYVIDHPGDIWYGHNSKYLKVIQDNSKRKIVLSSLEEWHARQMLNKVRLDYDAAKLHYPERSKGKSAVGKIFMSAIQMDFSDAENPSRARFGIRKPYKKPTSRSGRDQTAILLKLGIDAVEDRAKNIKDASINDREPEQICWLTPMSHKILETYRMSDNDKKSSTVVFSPAKVKTKLAAEISKSMKDKLENKDDHNTFWTTDGRRIEIKDDDVSLSWRMKNMKMGQKPHKMFNKDERHSLAISVFTERGNLTSYIGSDDNIQVAIDDIKQKFDKLPIEDNGKRYSKKQSDADDKSESARRSQEDTDRRNKQILSGWDNVFTKYNELAGNFNLNKIGDFMSDEQKLDTYKMMLVKMENPKVLKYYDDTNIEMLMGYLKMVNFLKTENLHISRLPESVLSDVSSNIGKLNEVKFKDFYEDYKST